MLGVLVCGLLCPLMTLEAAVGIIPGDIALPLARLPPVLILMMLPWLSLLMDEA